MLTHRRPYFVLALLLCRLSAQCQPTLSNALPREGVDGYIDCSTWWDADGPGPGTPLLVVGGRFHVAGSVVSRGIAAWDPSTGEWSGFAGGVSEPSYAQSSYDAGGVVTAVLASANGDLYVTGEFSYAGGVPCQRVARWTAGQWFPLADGLPVGSGHALAELPGGDIVLGGRFTQVGATSAKNIARWNGSTWSALGSGLVGIGGSDLVSALLVRSNGDLVVGGTFEQAGGVTARAVATWNGTWSALGPSTHGLSTVVALIERNGVVLAGGSAMPSNGRYLAHWDGVAWSDYGVNFSGASGTSVQGLWLLPNGSVFVHRSNDFLSECPGPTQPWTTRWQLAFGRIAGVLPSGEIVATGRSYSDFFTEIDGIGRWTGSEWAPLGQGFFGKLQAGVAVPGGYAVGGSFRRLGALAANNVALWNGASWQALGAGTNGTVQQLHRRLNGELVASGAFTQVGNLAVPGFAVWSGAAWTLPGGGPGAAVTCSLVLANDDVVVATANGLQRWNGATWSTFGGVAGVSITAMVEAPNGDLIVSGPFTSCGVPANNIARFDGTAWHALGGGLTGPCSTFAFGTGGELHATGNFLRADGQIVRGFARWNGVVWQGLGRTFLQGGAGLAVLPDGDLLVAHGSATGPFESAIFGGLSRWTGGMWVPTGSGLHYGLFTGYGTGNFVTPIAGGRYLVGGWFSRADGSAASSLFEIAPGCSPSIASIPNDCIGQAGVPMVASGAAEPQLGTTLTTSSNGYTSNSFGIVVYGFEVAQALWWQLPYGLPGCALFPTPDVLVLVLPAAGVAQFALAIPNLPSLLGSGLYHQFAQLSVDGSGALDRLALSNGLILTLRP